MEKKQKIHQQKGESFRGGVCFLLIQQKRVAIFFGWGVF